MRHETRYDAMELGALEVERQLRHNPNSPVAGAEAPKVLDRFRADVAVEFEDHSPDLSKCK